MPAPVLERLLRPTNLPINRALLQMNRGRLQQIRPLLRHLIPAALEARRSAFIALFQPLTGWFEPALISKFFNEFALILTFNSQFIYESIFSNELKIGIDSRFIYRHKPFCGTDCSTLRRYAESVRSEA
jgi:hypothetical protein